MRPTVLAPDHGCTNRPPDKCKAVRCTNGCGEFEHVRPYELPEDCLRHDLFVCYVEGHWCGPGLAEELRRALGRPSAAKRGDSEGGTRNRPGSRPPGWNADASALLADIGSRAADRDTLADWRRQARTILGFSVPSIALPDVACFVCGQASLRVAQDASSDVWCSETSCHDDEKYPYCTSDNLGYDRSLGYAPPECRRTDKALTHAVRWRRDSWAPIWQQMQAEKELEIAS